MLKLIKKLSASFKLLITKPHEALVFSFSALLPAFPELKIFLKTYPRYILVLSITSILPLIIAGIVFLFLITTKPSIEVPQLEGLSIIDAASIIQDKQLNIMIIPEDSEEYPQNFIIRQDIIAGRTIKEGRTLLLYISNGSTSIKFPSLIGKNIYTISSNLKQENDLLKAINIKNIKWVSSNKPFGEIIGQTPQTGNYKNYPISADVIVSNGANYSIPSFIGKYASFAFYNAHLLDLKLAFIFEIVDDPKLDGKVIRQEPKENTPITHAKYLHLVIGKYQESNIHQFVYEIEEEVAGKTIALIINDEKGKRFLYLGLASLGDKISSATPVFGKWKAGIYVYQGAKDPVLYKDLTL